MDLYVVNTNLDFDLSVDLSGDVLSLVIAEKLNDKGDRLETPITRTRTLSLSSLRNRPDFGDHAMFLLYDTASAGGQRVSDEVVNTVSNLYAMTYASKIEASNYHRLITQIFPLCAIYVPLASLPFERWAIAVRVNENAQVTTSSNLTVKRGVTIPVIGESIIFPTVQFDVPLVNVASDGAIDISFHLADPAGNQVLSGEADVYLEATGGTLVQNRVRTVGGRGTVSFRPNGLTPGATVKVKCGFKHFSGTDDCMVSVQ